jgi:hypothetical protein
VEQVKGKALNTSGETSGGEPIWKEETDVTDTKRERRHGCNRRKKGWKVRRGVGSEDIRKAEWWDDQCGEEMRRMHEDLPATTTIFFVMFFRTIKIHHHNNVGSRVPVERVGAEQGGDGEVDGK